MTIDTNQLVKGFLEKKALMPTPMGHQHFGSFPAAVYHGITGTAPGSGLGLMNPMSRVKAEMHPLNSIGNAAREGFGYVSDQISKGVDSNMNEMGIKTTHAPNGMANGVDLPGTASGLVGNYIKDQGNALKQGWNDVQLGYNKGGIGAAADNLGAWAGKNRWLAGGVGALGGLGLYGGYRLLKGMFGGEQQQQPQYGYAPPQTYGYPSAPMALPKYGMAKEAGINLPSIFSVPGMAASALSNSRENPQQVRTAPLAQQHAYNFQASADPQVQKILKNPRMMAYLNNVISSSERTE